MNTYLYSESKRVNLTARKKDPKTVLRTDKNSVVSWALMVK